MTEHRNLVAVFLFSTFFYLIQVSSSYFSLKFNKGWKKKLLNFMSDFNVFSYAVWYRF